METVVRENWITQRVTNFPVIVSGFATAVLFIVSQLYWNPEFIAGSLLSATREQVFVGHEYWRLWTTLLIHADLKHLVSNALLFFIIGIFLNAYFGVLLFPVVALAFGGLINLHVLQGLPDHVVLLGASGVVYWMGGFWLTLYLLLDSRRTFVQRALRAFGVAILLFMPAEAFEPSTSYSSHVVGFIYGLGFGAIYYWLRRSEFKRAEVLEVLPDEPPEGPSEEPI